MKTVTLEELLEAGAHFGHQVTRQNPKAREFIFEARDGIHIIDLAKTKEGLDAAADYIKDLAQNGGSLVVVGTKRQAQETVKEEVTRAQGQGAGDIYFVTNRWIGGTLTNAQEVTKNYKKFKELTNLLASQDARQKYTKRELGLFEKERQKLASFYGGISEMPELPKALFIVDTRTEVNAVNEARSMGVPIVGIVDTNADPLIIDYPIPANDDAVGSLKLIVGHIIDAWIEGKTGKAAAKTQAQSSKSQEKTEEKVEEKPAKKAKTTKKETVTESSIVAEESTAESVATQSKKKAANTKKLTGTKSNK